MNPFNSIGKFSVRLRWLVVLVWVIGVIVAVHVFPSLSSVTQSNNSDFLPTNAPIEKALKISSAFGKTNLTPVTVIAARSGTSLSAADQAAISRLETALSHIPKTIAVEDQGTSPDGQAEELVVESGGISNAAGTQASSYVQAIRSTIDGVALPSGLQVHLAGTIATEVDNSKTSGGQNNEVTLGAALFIIVLLILIFRAPLAPLVTLIPPLFVVTASGPIIAELAQHGLKVSVLVQLLLTVLVLGAGTDYGLFLIFRVKEEYQNGGSPNEAIVRALSRVGEAITFSAATVIAALLSLLLATFQIYSNLGIPLGIGIGMMLIAGLTLLPALLSIFGRAVFWPSKPSSQPGKFGLWGRVSARVVQHPLIVLLAGIVFFGGLTLAVPRYSSGGFGGTTTAPSGSDSAAGNALLAKHFPSSNVSPTSVLFVLPHDAWQDPAPLGQAQAQLSQASEFKQVTGPLNPNGISLTITELEHLYAMLGPPQLLPALQLTNNALVAPKTYQAYRATANYISHNGHTVQYLVSLSAGDPSTVAAMNAVPLMRSEVTQIAHNIGATNSGVAGEAPAFYDISSISNSDLIRIIPVAIIVIGILLAILLRSLIAPLYLVASVGLSYLASLGLTVLIFIDLGGNSGLNFILPFLMFIFLLALGEDYNILVMSRIREEAHNLPLKAAVTRAVTTTGTTVTSAGLVLAGTFGVLAVVAGSSSSEIREIGFALAIGILLDTFLVRTLVVPSIVVLLGDLNWWPSKLSRKK